MNIYVGNLSKDVDQENLKEVFEAFGQVNTIKIIIDRESGESKGFGFVDMPGKNDAEDAIKQLDGSELNGQVLKVSVARRRKEVVRNFGVMGGKLTRGGGKKF